MTVYQPDEIIGHNYRLLGGPDTDRNTITLTRDQFDALVVGLPWQRLEQLRVITRM